MDILAWNKPDFKEKFIGSIGGYIPVFDMIGIYRNEHYFASNLCCFFLNIKGTNRFESTGYY